jgi:hypothetical protein
MDHREDRTSHQDLATAQLFEQPYEGEIVSRNAFD